VLEPSRLRSSWWWCGARCKQRCPPACGCRSSSDALLQMRTDRHTHSDTHTHYLHTHTHLYTHTCTQALSEDARRELPAALRRLFAAHSVCSMANVRQWLLDPKGGGKGAAREAATLTDQALNSAVRVLLPLLMVVLLSLSRGGHACGSGVEQRSACAAAAACDGGGGGAGGGGDAAAAEQRRPRSRTRR